MKKLSAMNKDRLLTYAEQLLKERSDKQLKRALLQQDFHAIGYVINHLLERKRRVFVMLPPEIQAEVILTLTENSKRTILRRLSNYTVARFLHFNDEDDVADIISFLTPEQQISVLEKLKATKRKKIEKLLRYGPETAGGLMDLNFIIVKPEFTLKDISEKVQYHIKDAKKAPLVIVTDKSGVTRGYIPYKNLILTPPHKTVLSLTKPLPTVSYRTDQENIVHLFSGSKSDVIGVVDEGKYILGIIHVQDLLKVAQAEATEDVYKFAGVSREENTLDPASIAVKLRYKWLIINLGTAFVASLVVSHFENTIASVAILAAYMPIVAGLGGNAGTQTLAVVVRGLALGHVSWRNARYIILKEITAGLINGLITGTTIALIIFFLRGTPIIGLILGISMVINLFIAGFFGTVIPLTLKAFDIDPAVASSVFVTAATDILGFLVFLGLATAVLL